MFKTAAIFPLEHKLCNIRFSFTLCCILPSCTCMRIARLISSAPRVTQGFRNVLQKNTVLEKKLFINLCYFNFKSQEGCKELLLVGPASVSRKIMEQVLLYGASSPIKYSTNQEGYGNGLALWMIVDVYLDSSNIFVKVSSSTTEIKVVRQQ